MTHDTEAHDDLVSDEDQVEVAEIRADIEETRREMGGTLSELGERLDPGHLVEQAKDNVREATIGRIEETAKGMSDMVMDTIKRNPVPAALAGAGLALLWANRSQGQPSDDRRERSGFQSHPTTSFGTDRHEGLGSKIGDTASSVGQTVGQAVGSVADGAQQVGGEVIGRAGETAQQVTWKLDSFMQASSLAMGAIAVGAGAVVASLVPETTKEREMLGDASRQVSGVVRDTVGDVASKAEETLDRAEDKVTASA